MSDEQQTPFFFDEFFEDPTDEGFELPVKIAGRVVPIRIKKGLSNADRAAAELACLRRAKLPNGEVKLLGIDEGKLTDELTVRAIISWPFVYGPKHHLAGQPVPVTRENLSMLKGGADDIMAAIAKFDKEGAAALATFSRPAEEATQDEADR